MRRSRKFIEWLFRFFFAQYWRRMKGIRLGRRPQILFSFAKTPNNGSIVVGDNCVVRNCRFTADGSLIVVGAKCVLENLDITASAGSTVNCSEGAILSFKDLKRGDFTINSGELLIMEKANIKSNIFTRFNGRVIIGKHTAIGQGTEIVCDELVEIGAYCLFSYDVSIYDTNSHSTNWEERAESIVAGYPYGTSETTKPSTLPIFIGDHVWVGKNASILKGAHIGNKSIVGLGAIVPKGNYHEGSTIVNAKPSVSALE